MSIFDNTPSKISDFKISSVVMFEWKYIARSYAGRKEQAKGRLTLPVSFVGERFFLKRSPPSAPAKLTSSLQGLVQLKSKIPLKPACLGGSRQLQSQRGHYPSGNALDQL